MRLEVHFFGKARAKRREFMPKNEYHERVN
jgi:hypothetical protein